MNQRSWMPMVAIVSFVLIAASSAFLYLRQLPTITAGNAAKIVPGMLFHEVVAILGPPRIEPVDPKGRDVGTFEFDTDINFPAATVLWDQYYWLGEFDLVLVTINPTNNRVESVEVSKHGVPMATHDFGWHIGHAVGYVRDDPTTSRPVPGK